MNGYFDYGFKIQAEKMKNKPISLLLEIENEKFKINLFSSFLNKKWSLKWTKTKMKKGLCTF